MIDPVCGLEVSRQTVHSLKHAGVQYWFCSRDCEEEFDEDPEGYADIRGFEGGEG